MGRHFSKVRGPRSYWAPSNKKVRGPRPPRPPQFRRLWSHRYVIVVNVWINWQKLTIFYRNVYQTIRCSNRVLEYPEKYTSCFSTLCTLHDIAEKCSTYISCVRRNYDGWKFPRKSLRQYITDVQSWQWVTFFRPTWPRDPSVNWPVTRVTHDHDPWLTTTRQSLSQCHVWP